MFMLLQAALQNLFPCFIYFIAFLCMGMRLQTAVNRSRKAFLRMYMLFLAADQIFRKAFLRMYMLLIAPVVVYVLQHLRLIAHQSPKELAVLILHLVSVIIHDCLITAVFCRMLMQNDLILAANQFFHHSTAAFRMLMAV